MTASARTATSVTAATRARASASSAAPRSTASDAPASSTSSALPTMHSIRRIRATAATIWAAWRVAVSCVNSRRFGCATPARHDQDRSWFDGDGQLGPDRPRQPRWELRRLTSLSTAVAALARQGSRPTLMVPLSHCRRQFVAMSHGIRAGAITSSTKRRR